MALSSEEHTLLVQTCDSMNLSAEVNREVLELVRNLGNTGVVDIATHNNDANAHANVKSIVHLNTGLNSVSIGDPGFCNDKGTHSDDTHAFFRLLGGGGFYPSSSIRKYGNDLVLLKNGYATGNCPVVHTYFLESNADGEIATEYSNRDVFGLYANYQYLDSGTVKTKQSKFFVRNSPSLIFGTTETTCWVLNAFSGSGGSNILAFGTSALTPLSGFTSMTLGMSTLPFGGAYLSSAVTVTSDRREKIGISALDSKAVDFIKSLRPVQFVLRAAVQKPVAHNADGDVTEVEDVPGVRHHWGLIAQEVQEALSSAGYSPSDCAVWSLSDKDDPDSRQALRYEEILAPLIKTVQQQQERIEALERRLA